MQGELDKLKAQGKEALSFDELMAQPVFLQIWSDFVSPSHNNQNRSVMLSMM